MKDCLVWVVKMEDGKLYEMKSIDFPNIALSHNVVIEHYQLDRTKVVAMGHRNKNTGGKTVFR